MASPSRDLLPMLSHVFLAFDVPELMDTAVDVIVDLISSPRNQFVLFLLLLQKTSGACAHRHIGTPNTESHPVWWSLWPSCAPNCAKPLPVCSFSTTDDYVTWNKIFF